MRKLASVFLAVAMLWSCSFTAFAYTYSDIAGSPALVSDTDSLETYALDTEIETENFSYPYPVAFQNMDMPLNESISYRIGRKLLVF